MIDDCQDISISERLNINIRDIKRNLYHETKYDIYRLFRVFDLQIQQLENNQFRQSQRLLEKMYRS